MCSTKLLLLDNLQMLSWKMHCLNEHNKTIPSMSLRENLLLCDTLACKHGFGMRHVSGTTKCWEGYFLGRHFGLVCSSGLTLTSELQFVSFPFLPLQAPWGACHSRLWMLSVSKKSAPIPHHCLVFGSTVSYKAIKKINHFSTNRNNGTYYMRSSVYIFCKKFTPIQCLPILKCF